MTGHFQHPFHCVQFLDRQSNGSQDLLIASAGPKIYSYAAKSGQRLAVWPQNAEPSDKDGAENSQEPPEKKRRVSDSGAPKREDAKSAAKEMGKPTASIEWSNIPLLVASSNGKHVVALTGEDKCIRVLSVGEDGVLDQLSARYGSPDSGPFRDADEMLMVPLDTCPSGLPPLFWLATTA